MPPLNWRANKDFENVIVEELGQSVQRIPVMATTDDDGRTTNVVEGSAVALKAAVVEVTAIHKQWLEMGLVRVGDIVVYTKEADTINQFDVVVWQGRRYIARDISRPPRVGDANFAYLEVKCHREAT